MILHPSAAGRVWQKGLILVITFRHEDGTQVLLEIVGFWTPEYLAQKRKTLQHFARHNILIAVPEKSLRKDTTPGKNVFTYKTALKVAPLMEILERIRTEDTTA